MELLEPAALFAVWLGLVVTVLEGLTSLLGMEKVWRPRHTGVSPSPRADEVPA